MIKSLPSKNGLQHSFLLLLQGRLHPLQKDQILVVRVRTGLGLQNIDDPMLLAHHLSIVHDIEPPSNAPSNFQIGCIPSYTLIIPKEGHLLQQVNNVLFLLPPNLQLDYHIRSPVDEKQYVFHSLVL